VLKHAATGSNGVTVLRVPAGKSVLLMDKLNTGAPLPAVNLTLQHRVRRGESLQNIADQYHVSAQRLARANGIGKKHPLKSGLVLTVPSSLFDAPELLDDHDPRASTAYVPERTIAPPTQINAESSAEGRLTHTVHRGETLSSIAAKYDVSTADIRRWNRLSSNSVRRGTRLKIRTGEDADSAQVAASADSVTIANMTPPYSRKKSRSSSSATASAVNGVIVVRPGDTLSGLARRHGVSVSALKEANGLGTTPIRAGQRLRLPT
jgi:membrane-bound lytic murein transglycosylase D